jgi:hypothetical protein
MCRLACGMAALALIAACLPSVSATCNDVPTPDHAFFPGGAMEMLGAVAASHRALRFSSPVCATPEAALREARVACSLARQALSLASRTAVPIAYDHSMVLRFASASAAADTVAAIWEECQPETSGERGLLGLLRSAGRNRGHPPPERSRMPSVAIAELVTDQSCTNACGAVEDAFALLPLLVHRLCHSGQPAIAGCAQLRVFVLRPERNCFGVVPRVKLSTSPSWHASFWTVNIPHLPRQALYDMLDTLTSSGAVRLRTLTHEEAEEIRKGQEQRARSEERRLKWLEDALEAQLIYHSRMLQDPNGNSCIALEPIVALFGFRRVCLVQHVPLNGTPAPSLEARRAFDVGQDDQPAEVQTVKTFLYSVIDAYFVNMHVRFLGEPVIRRRGLLDEPPHWQALMLVCCILSLVWVADETLTFAQRWGPILRNQG